MAAFRLAVEQRSDLVELDVHLTRDGEVVVLHDDTLDRTTTGSGWVADHTWAEIGRLDAGSWFGPAYAGECVPRLVDVLAWARAEGVALAVEVKRPNPAMGRPAYPNFGQRVIELVEQYGLADRVLLHSDDHRSMRACKQLAPHIATAVAVGSADYLDLIGLVQTAGADGVTIHWRWVTPELTARCHAARLHVFGYGIHEDLSEPGQVTTLLANGVDIVSSAYPDRLFQLVAEWQRAQPPVPSVG
jgi:glycerophosphoryl diester phosphodiesterase